MIGVTAPVGDSGGGSINGDTFQFGNMIIFKKPTNLNKGMLEIGDGGMGVVQGVMINFGYYLGGDIALTASWDPVTSQPF